ncbi:HVO_A0114 family putative DNA-binding protein [Magnetococcales bacterium HHB-1]
MRPVQQEIRESRDIGKGQFHETLRFGVASFEEMRTMIRAIARGEKTLPKNAPDVWFSSMHAMALVLSQNNLELLHLIAKRAPENMTTLATDYRCSKECLDLVVRRLKYYKLVRMKRSVDLGGVPEIAFNRLEICGSFSPETGHWPLPVTMTDYTPPPDDKDYYEVIEREHRSDGSLYVRTTRVDKKSGLDDNGRALPDSGWVDVNVDVENAEEEKKQRKKIKQG